MQDMKIYYLLQWKPFENDEKRFLFYLSRDLFGHVEKMAWSER